LNEAGNGDCILVQSATTNILIDGGTAKSFQCWSKEILTLPKLDSLIITHIDDDHVNGIIKYFDTKHVHAVENIFFNGVSQITGFNHGNAAEYDCDFDSIAVNFEDTIEDSIDIGFSEGTSVSFIIESKLIEINKMNNGKAIHCKSFMTPVYIGDISVQFLGPTCKALESLKKSWLNILKENGIKRKILTKKHSIAFESYVNTLGKYNNVDEDISDINCDDIVALANTIFEPDNSLSNETSLSFILKNNDKSILMLGDAHIETIIDWLDLNSITTLEVDAIKVPHHGSKHNFSKEFIQRVSCNTYFISTNGKKFGHPHLEVLARIAIFSKKENTKIYINNDIEHISKTFIKKLLELPNKVAVIFNQKEVNI
jgi:beta-lactamase superfamily II metal-dependent hydrolase